MSIVRSTLLVTLLALAARVGLLLAQPGLTYDGTYYLRQAERLQRLEYEVFGFPPGYPFAVAPIAALLGDPVLAGRLVSLVAGVAMIALFHVWSRRRLSTPVALAASIVLAVHPHLMRTNVEVLSESLYMLVVLGGVMWFEGRRHVAASLAFGFAFLCRPEAIVLLAGFTLLHAVRARRMSWPLLLPGLALVAAYATWASLALGSPLLSPKQGQLDLSLDVVARARTSLTTLHAVFPLVLVPGALIYGMRSLPGLLIPVAYLALLPLYDIHIQERLHLPALPFLLVLGLAWASTLRRPARRAVLAASTVLLAVGAFPAIRHFGSPGIMTPHAQEIGIALRPHLEFDDRVAGRFPFVSYYAGAGFVRQPLAAYSALLDSLLSWGATHLIVLENEMQNISPQLRPLFEDAAFVAAEGRVRAVAWVSDWPGSRAILYEMLEPPVSPRTTTVVRRGVTGVTWTADALVVTTQAGELEWIETGTTAAAPSEGDPRDLGAVGARDPFAAENGDHVVFVARVDGEEVIVNYESRSGERTPFQNTAADRPSGPVYVGDQILYVRRAPPGGLRLLDPQSGRVRDARLLGLDPGAATPVSVVARGSQVAITYIPAQRAHDAQRVIATADWPRGDPDAIATAGVVELPGRWATQLTLTNDKICWAPWNDRVLAVVGVREVDETGATTRMLPSLAVVQSDGLYRRLAFGFDTIRAPAVRGASLAFLGANGTLHTLQLSSRDLEIPSPRVFANGR